MDNEEEMKKDFFDLQEQFEIAKREELDPIKIQEAKEKAKNAYKKLIRRYKRYKNEADDYEFLNDNEQ